MVLKAEQEKLKKLLTEAIPLLCKNGVQFKTEFAIEALIGITLDKDEVVLVSIKETVQADYYPDDPVDSPAGEIYDNVPQMASPVHSDLPHREIDPRRRKRKTPGRRPSSYTAGSPARESYTNTPVGTPQFSQPATPDHSTPADGESLLKKPKSELDAFESATLTVKKEPTEEADDDLVFVKDDSSDIDLSQMLGQHGEMVSFPNVSLSSQKQRREHTLTSPNAAMGYNNSSQNLQESSFNTEPGPSQQASVRISTAASKDISSAKHDLTSADPDQPTDLSITPSSRSHNTPLSINSLPPKLTQSPKNTWLSPGGSQLDQNYNTLFPVMTDLLKKERALAAAASGALNGFPLPPGYPDWQPPTPGSINDEKPGSLPLKSSPVPSPSTGRSAPASIPGSSGKSRSGQKTRRGLVHVPKGTYYTGDHPYIIREEIDPKNYLCRLCGLHFKTFRIASDHLRGIHQNSYMYFCEVCGESFKWRSTLRAHKLKSPCYINREQPPVPESKVFISNEQASVPTVKELIQHEHPSVPSPKDFLGREQPLMVNIKDDTVQARP